MPRVAVFSRVLLSGAVLTGFSLVVLKFGFMREASLPQVLGASALVGLAGGLLDGAFLWMSLLEARELRRRVEGLLDAGKAEPLTPARDEMAALAASLELATRRMRVMVESLQRDSSRLEAILGSMVEGVVSVDPLLRITFVNRAFAEQMGVALPVPPGTPLVQVTREHALLDLFTAAFAGGQPLQKKLILSSAARSFEVQVAPLAGDPQRGAIAMLYDITDLERLERVRKDFVANVSHEVRTPLAAISGYAETLVEGALEDPDNSRKFAEIILSKARLLTNIVQDLLVLSSLESAKAPVPEPVSLRGSIESAMRSLEPVARMRSVHLVCGDFDDLSVLGYELRLEQVFVNLLDNAVKFNRPDGEVRVEVSREDGQAVVRVRDTGLGIPSRDLPRIFERFYRVDKARSRATGGTGLGLAIVKHAVEQMGGSVAVESRLGQGTVFTVTLPPVENSIPAIGC